MKYSEEEFKQKIHQLYNGEIELVSRYKGLHQPVLVKDKYGVMRLQEATYVLQSRPSIKAALNKTSYFMEHLKDKYPQIAESLIPQSEYVKAKGEMLFLTQYGLVKSTPDALLAGHMPNIKSAVNRKEYFRQQLLQLYDYKYDFIITSTSRHHGRVTLVCPIHGEQSVDSDGIFLGVGCPACNRDYQKSNVFYLIRLYNETESFYKLGISCIKNNQVRRYKDYLNLGYQVEEIKRYVFENYVDAHDFETKLKRIIKPNLYQPQHWANSSTTECFSEDLLTVILDKIKYDIVSTSTEMQSSLTTDKD